jgi:phosphoglycerate dehydrogenase-like enzyme
MKIAVLDDYQRVASDMADWSALAGCQVDFFHDQLRTVDEIRQALASYEALVLMRERTVFPAEVFRALPMLKLVVTTGMINRSIDLAAAASCGVLVCGTPWAEDATVEVTWGHILSLAHAMVQEDASLRAGRWQSTLGHSLKGKTLGVIGLGTIGTKVARIGLAFGMNVLAFSPHLSAERAAAAGAQAVGKEQLMRQADVVSIHMILSEQTRGMVGAPELALMRRTAILVNTSRGALVDEHALAEALHAGQLGGAGIDVYSQEPIPADHPLLRAPGTLLTPHIGYVTHDVYRAWYGAVIEAIQACLAGAPMRVLNG